MRKERTDLIFSALCPRRNAYWRRRKSARCSSLQNMKSSRAHLRRRSGYFSYSGDIDFAIVIRTLVKSGRTLTMRAGAGIVADSDPAKEYQETINKSKAAFEAVKFAEEEL